MYGNVSNKTRFWDVFLGPLRELKKGQKHNLLNVLTFQDSEVAMSFAKTLQLDAILSPNVKFQRLKFQRCVGPREK
jgi:hypothetical protein